MQLGIGIIGCGGASLALCRAIDAVPDLRLAAAHDLNERNASDLAGPRGGVVHRSLDALLADPAVDMVYIALPHHLLAPTAERALRAGRHALVEKPMALDDDEARRLGRLAHECDRRLGVCFQLREAAAVRGAHRLVSDGAIGDVCAVRIRTTIDKSPEYWQSGLAGRAHDGWHARRAQAGGGVVLTNSIHQIDLVRSITGLSFVRAVAEVATLSAKVEVEDTAGAVLRLSNGGVVNLTASAHSPGASGEERIEIDGKFGRIDLPDLYNSGVIRLFTRLGWEGHPAGEWADITPPMRDPHVEMLRGFVQAVRLGTDPPAAASDAAAALATILAIYESARTGQAVVPRSVS